MALVLDVAFTRMEQRVVLVSPTYLLIGDYRDMQTHVWLCESGQPSDITPEPKPANLGTGADNEAGPVPLSRRRLPQACRGSSLLQI